MESVARMFESILICLRYPIGVLTCCRQHSAYEKKSISILLRFWKNRMRLIVSAVDSILRYETVKAVEFVGDPLPGNTIVSQGRAGRSTLGRQFSAILRLKNFGEFKTAGYL